MATLQKVQWHGTINSIQPRIQLLRSFGERAHSYLGYALNIDGKIGDEELEFMVAIGKAAQVKNSFQVGDEVSGMSIQVPDKRMEVAEFYKTIRLKILQPFKYKHPNPPPFLDFPPSLDVYRERGHRRLAAKNYEKKCLSCIWGCKMPVEMIIDHWNPTNKHYRFETFCYGPKSCSFYKAGPTRKVPGRKKWMVYEEEDWVDEEATRHRGPDD